MRDYAGELSVYLDSDLYRAGWNGAFDPYPGIPPRQFAMQHLRRSIVKKFSDGQSSDADAKALSLFRKVNDSCREYNLGASSITEIEAISIGEAKNFIHRFFYPDFDDHENFHGPIVNLHRIAERFGLGNGANIGSFGTDFLSKVGTSTMAATSTELHSYFVKAIAADRIWSSVESTRSATRACAVVRGSRLSFVPKTREISRTICTEPVLNMLFQKGIGSILEERLRQICGIDLTSQPDKNRILARLGSIDGRFGTIDLSSASDSMSLGLVREFFPASVVRWLELTRCPVTTLPGGTEVELHMVSSMGNAFTFPLQTLFFASLVYGAYRARSIKIEYPRRQSLGNFAVFGDDIIVVREAYDLVSRLLCLCGFKVNVDKSFNDGFFRESCGHDYYQGRNVRGVYVKHLVDMSDRFSAINRLNVWSAEHGILLSGTVQYLREGTKKLFVPFDEQDIAGIKVPYSLLTNVKRNRSTGGVSYRYLDVVNKGYSVQDVESQPPRIRGWINNPDAVLLAALAGTLRSGKIVHRALRRSVRLKRRSSSRWDYIVSGQSIWTDFGERWKSYVEFNLTLK